MSVQRDYCGIQEVSRCCISPKRRDGCATFLINLNSRFSNAAKRQYRFHHCHAISKPELRNTRFRFYSYARERLEILRYNCGNRSLWLERRIVLFVYRLLSFYLITIYTYTHACVRLYIFSRRANNFETIFQIYFFFLFEILIEINQRN